MPPQPATPTPAPSQHQTDHPHPYADLLTLFTHISDPRDPRGLLHRLPSLLALAACATTSGARTLQEITEWAHDAPDQIHLALHTRYDVITERFTPPCLATFERVFALLQAQELEEATTTWISAHTRPGRAISVDGKALRGSTDTDTPMTFLLSALSQAHKSVLAQRRIDDKSNEIPALGPLLDGIGPDLLAGATITADALHTQRATAELIRCRGADYLLYAKENQPALFAALDALDWEHTPVGHTDQERGHNRREKRTIQVRPAPEHLDWPHTAQVFLIERYTWDRHGARVRASAHLGLTSLDAGQATARDLAELARGHWAIENSLHWVRDVLYREDAHALRKGSGPQVMACLRNLALSALRLAGYESMASALRYHARRPQRPLQTLRIAH